MRANIKAKNLKLFNPFFQTVILGQPTKVSLKDAQENAEKYINSPIGPLYENYQELKKKIDARGPKIEPDIIDMNNVNRGYSFDKNKKTARQAAIDKVMKDQERKQARIKKKVEQNVADRKASEAETKKAVDAALKKERAKKKKEESSK